MAALDNKREERYAQARATSGTPGGRSIPEAVKYAIYPSTSVTEAEQFRARVTTSTAVADRITEIG